MISVICSEFNIGPDEAAATDYLRVKQIMDYRAVERGIALINRGAEGMKELGENPFIQTALLNMYRAQSPELTNDMMMAKLAEDAALVDTENETDDDME